MKTLFRLIELSFDCQRSRLRLGTQIPTGPGPVVGIGAALGVASDTDAAGGNLSYSTAIFMPCSEVGCPLAF
jgi:hypothetical protein